MVSHPKSIQGYRKNVQKVQINSNQPKLKYCESCKHKPTERFYVISTVFSKMKQTSLLLSWQTNKWYSKYHLPATSDSLNQQLCGESRFVYFIPYHGINFKFLCILTQMQVKILYKVGYGERGPHCMFTQVPGHGHFFSAFGMVQRN